MVVRVVAIDNVLDRLDHGLGTVIQRDGYVAPVAEAWVPVIKASGNAHDRNESGTTPCL